MEWLNSLLEWKILIILVVFFVGYISFQLFKTYRIQTQIIELQNSLKAGDLILTNSGIYGEIVNIDKNKCELKIAKDVYILVDRFSINRRVKNNNLERGTEVC
jgi:preprotein translocase YajC subunit